MPRPVGGGWSSRTIEKNRDCSENPATSWVFHRTKYPASRGALVFAVAVALAAGWVLGSAGPVQGAPSAKEILVGKGCVACHKIPGIPQAVGTIGPSLKGFASKRRFAGDVLENNRENLKKWLKNPKAVKRTMMPNLRLTDAEIEILIEFLNTL